MAHNHYYKNSSILRGDFLLNYRKFKLVITLEFTTISAIFFIHCWALFAYKRLVYRLIAPGISSKWYYKGPLDQVPFPPIIPITEPAPAPHNHPSRLLFLSKKRMKHVIDSASTSIDT